MDRTSYQKDANGDLVIKNGTFARVGSDAQHVTDIVLSAPGSNRRHPTRGFNAKRFINAPTSEAARFVAELQAQLSLDGYPGLKVDVSKGFKNLCIYEND